MKRLLCLILTVAITLSMLPAASASTVINGAKVSGDYEYKINSDKKTATIVYYNGNFEKSAQIPSKVGGKTVTEIAWGAFGSLWMLENVSIPNSIKTIADEAFLNCTGLTTVSIGTGVKNLPGNPFDGCTSLSTIKIASNHKYLTVQDGVLFLKDGMKLRCYPAAKSGTTYTLPDGVTEIGDSAFSGNNNLKTLVIPASVTNIHKTAFNNGTGGKQAITLDVTNNAYAKQYAIDTGMNYVDKTLTVMPEPVEPMEYYTVGYRYVLLEDGTAEIVKHTLSSPKPQIVIPEEVDGHIVTSIRAEAFSSDNITSVEIPDNVIHLTGNPFSYCDNLKTVRVSPNHPTLATIDGVLFDKKQKALICYPHGIAASEYIIPQGILSIGFAAFWGHKQLISITIPDSVTAIGEKAFLDCSSLKTITIPDSVTVIGEKAFSDCSSLASINIPGSVTSVGELAFAECYALINVTISDGAISISKGAFKLCKSLTSITIPNSVSFEDNPFAFCTNLQEISISSEHPTLTTIDGVLFSKDQKKLLFHPTSLEKANYTIPDSVISIGYAAFGNPNSWTSVAIPDGVTSIGEYAFSGCESLSNITIPDSVTSIGDLAFNGCESLSSIAIPDSVTSIGEYAFYNCESLSSITIPDGVTSIGMKTFSGCESLSNITIPDGVTSIGEYAFQCCKSLSSITIPYGVTSIEDWTFAGCTALVSITIPASVKFIGRFAFVGADLISAIVESQSYAEEYCKNNNITYNYHSSLDWLIN